MSFFSFSIIRKRKTVGSRTDHILCPYILSVSHSCTFAEAFEQLSALSCDQTEVVFSEPVSLFAGERPRCFLSKSPGVDSPERNEASLGLNIRRCVRFGMYVTFELPVFDPAVGGDKGGVGKTNAFVVMMNASAEHGRQRSLPGRKGSEQYQENLRLIFAVTGNC